MNSSILFYDDHCPLCVCYTKFFVRTGLLAPEERQAFSAIPENWLSKIDFVKGTNEIPLVNKETGKVLYGIDALLEILGRKMPVVKTIGHWAPINFLLRKLYKLISYNRKVITAIPCGPGEIDCSPSFDYRYRTLFLFLGLLFNTLMLIPAHQLLQSIPTYTLNFWELQTGHFLLVASNLSLAFFLNKEKAFEFLGQVNMLALTSNLLLIPLIVSAAWLSVVAVKVFLVMLVVLVFREYIRRMGYAGILKSYSWIAGMQLGGMALFLLFLFGNK